METSYDVGRRAELLVQKSLWSKNYRVKDVSTLRMGYDLLVNDKYRVEVKSLRGQTTVKLDGEKFDILAVAVLTPIRDSIYYLKNKKDLNNMVAKNTNNLTKINSDIIKKYFTSKTKEVFI